MECIYVYSCGVPDLQLNGGQIDVERQNKRQILVQSLLQGPFEGYKFQQPEVESNLDRSVPPKVEAFCWQLLHGKITIKSNLAFLNLLQGSNYNCSFCVFGTSHG
ncbi:hypothetical protein DITRI_Ditri01bG0137800 [Diplodiscus trichospermus]